MSQEIVENLANNFRTTSMEAVEYENCKGDSPFDEVIGHIEDLLMEEEFQKTQREFLEKYWQIFEPTEENKLIYTDIFQEYNKAIEAYIDRRLTEAMPNFSMNDFLAELGRKAAELDGEVFDVLSTFTDFISFKEMLLDYRAVKEGKVEDLSDGISITSVKCANSGKIAATI